MTQPDPGMVRPVGRPTMRDVAALAGVSFKTVSRVVNGVSTVKNGAPYCPSLAALGTTGVNYVSASTSKPSDSFPGLTAIVTGGSPAFTGVYYDVAYSRNYDAPAETTGNGLAAGLAPPTLRPRAPRRSMKKASTSTRPK